MKTSEQEAARAIELELHRLRDSCERQLTLEVWSDGRCKISCSTGMRIARCRKLLDTLRNWQGSKKTGTDDGELAHAADGGCYGIAGTLGQTEQYRMLQFR